MNFIELFGEMYSGYMSMNSVIWDRRRQRSLLETGSSSLPFTVLHRVVMVFGHSYSEIVKPVAAEINHHSIVSAYEYVP